MNVPSVHIATNKTSNACIKVIRVIDLSLHRPFVIRRFNDAASVFHVIVSPEVFVRWIMLMMCSWLDNVYNVLVVLRSFYAMNWWNICKTAFFFRSNRSISPEIVKLFFLDEMFQLPVFNLERFKNRFTYWQPSTETIVEKLQYGIFQPKMMWIREYKELLVIVLVGWEIETSFLWTVAHLLWFSATKKIILWCQCVYTDRTTRETVLLAPTPKS